MDRRTFLSTTGAATLVGATTLSAANSEPQKKRIAVITTVWRYLSHAQHMVDRFLVGYPHEGAWHRPNIEIVSLYVDQRPQGDQSQRRADEFGFRIYPTVSDAVRDGTTQLAVDGVLIIGEHGDYPRNEKGQILYPRSEFFMQVAEVFRQDGISVPVFNDKHLSYSFTKANKMVRTARELGIAFMAGSSLPVTFRLPSVEMPFGAQISEALMVGVGGSDPMDFHALEAMQSMLERRAGGETGVRSVRLVDGAAVWRAGDAGSWSYELLEAALSRSNQPQGLSVSESKPQDLIRSGRLKELVTKPAAYLVEYNDGLSATLLMLNGAVGDFTFAAKLANGTEISTLFYLPPNPNVTYSAELMNRVEQMFLSGKATYPVERTLLTSGMLESCLDSRAAGGTFVNTPHLSVRYQVGEASLFARS